MEKTYLSCAETAKLVRTALAARWPGVKFSVRSKTYSGGASIDVSWTDGPPQKSVETVVKEFEGADFDGMQDLKTYHDSMLNGRRVHFGSNFVFCNRDYSVAAIEALARRTMKKYGIRGELVIAEPTKWSGAWIKNVSDLRDASGQDLGFWVWQEANDYDLYTPPARPAAVVAAVVAPVVAPYTGQDCEITVEGMWTWVKFPAKPADRVLDGLKAMGLRWSGKRAAWYASKPVNADDIRALVGA